MSTTRATIERKENGYAVVFTENLSTKEFVYRTLPEALQKAAYELDYEFKGSVEFPGEGWKK